MTMKEEQRGGKRRMSWWERAGGHVEATRTSKKWVEMKNLIKPCWLAGARLSGWEGRVGTGLSGAAHLQKPLRSVYVCSVTLCFLCQTWLGPARQNWDRVSSACSGGPSPVDA